jgi:hypothetical protein
VEGRIAGSTSATGFAAGNTLAVSTVWDAMVFTNRDGFYVALCSKKQCLPLSVPTADCDHKSNRSEDLLIQQIILWLARAWQFG